MAWFLNRYQCYRCELVWEDEWSCMCDDDCPHCGARHCSPLESEDLSGYIEKAPSTFIVYVSDAIASDAPEYFEVGRYRTERTAKAVMTRIIRREWSRALDLFDAESHQASSLPS
jgi:predicted  nucleic acid-binding Zn-ribbon protein